MKFRFLVWLALPIILWWVMPRIPFDEVRGILLSLEFSRIALLLLINFIIIMVFSTRWWSILHTAKFHVPYLQFAGYRLASFGVSIFTPGPQFGGEPLQVYFAHKRHNIPSTTAAASVSLDKVFEISANFTFLTIGVLFFIREGIVAGINGVQEILPVSILALLPIIYLVFLVLGFTPISQFYKLIPSRISGINLLIRIQKFLAQVEINSRSLVKSNYSIVLKSLVISILVWILLIGEYWFTLSILGAKLNLTQVIIALTAARIALLVPLPGGLGAFEAGQVAVLNSLGVDPAISISLILLIRIRDIVFGVCGLALGYAYTRKIELAPAVQHIWD